MVAGAVLLAASWPATAAPARCDIEYRFTARWETSAPCRAWIEAR
jgi:hypothetical protein